MSAISNKLTTVLSASYADSDIRHALETLDESGFENTATSRRELRLDVQKEVSDCNGEIIRDFGRVAEQLKKIGLVIGNLQQCCEDMRQQISEAHQQTGPVLKEADALIKQKSEAETKQQLLAAVTARFTLSDDDLTALTSPAKPVDDDFFSLLKRTQQIHHDCQVLLGMESQTLGLDIMEQSSKNINAAFQKLFRWVQREFKSLDLENPQINSQVRRALRVLAQRPSLFQGCLEFFADGREHVLSDSFQLALTGISDKPDKLKAKPIELYAHDPLRYLGDMLAWVHSATVSEREALEVLFISEGNEIAKEIEEGMASQPWAQAEDESVEPFDGKKALSDVVGRDLTGVGRQLRQRVEQLIQGHEEPTLAYQIANLINFYSMTFRKLLGEGAVMMDILSSLEELALRQFRATMQDQVLAVQGDLTRPEADLRPPEFMTEALDRLRVLMKSYDTSLVATSNREIKFESILSEALDPFLVSCDAIAGSLGEPESSTFSINCLLAAKETMSAFSFTRTRMQSLDDSIKKLSDNLLNYQHGFFLHSSGLDPLLAVLTSISDSEEDTRKLRSLEVFSAEALSKTSQMLDEFLPSALMDAIENLKRLQDSGLVHRVTEEAADLFCEDFEFVEQRIVAADELREGDDADDDAEDLEATPLRALFPRTSEEVRVLLS